MNFIITFNGARRLKVLGCHGDADGAVPISAGRDLVETLKSQGLGFQPHLWGSPPLDSGDFLEKHASTIIYFCGILYAVHSCFSQNMGWHDMYDNLPRSKVSSGGGGRCPRRFQELPGHGPCLLPRGWLGKDPGWHQTSWNMFQRSPTASTRNEGSPGCDKLHPAAAQTLNRSEGFGCDVCQGLKHARLFNSWLVERHVFDCFYWKQRKEEGVSARWATLVWVLYSWVVHFCLKRISGKGFVFWVKGRISSH